MNIYGMKKSDCIITENAKSRKQRRRSTPDQKSHSWVVVKTLPLRVALEGRRRVVVMEQLRTRTRCVGRKGRPKKDVINAWKGEVITGVS